MPRSVPWQRSHPGRARLLLKAGKAAVFKSYPFTLILNAPVPSPRVRRLRLKIDPGSRVTGLALVDDETGEVLWAAELTRPGPGDCRTVAAAQGCTP